MSFPPSANNDSRPATKGLVLGPDDGDPYFWLGTLSIPKITRQLTTGNFDIVDHRVPPGYAPPRHVHRDSDEVFYIIDGRFTVHCGDDTWQAEPGALVFLPRGIPHGFEASKDGPARTLLFNAPAGFADLIVALGRSAPSTALPGPDVPMPSQDEIARESDRFGIAPPPSDEG